MNLTDKEKFVSEMALRIVLRELLQKDQLMIDTVTASAHNLAVGCDPYTTAVLTDVKSILTREANYHPDSGQVFYPVDEVPFYLLLAKEGDDIKATDFVAFYFDGTVGCQIKPGIWHQPPYPVRRAEFLNKQGAVHACVGYDSIEEEECWLEIILV